MTIIAIKVEPDVALPLLHRLLCIDTATIIELRVVALEDWAIRCAVLRVVFLVRGVGLVSVFRGLMDREGIREI